MNRTSNQLFFFLAIVFSNAGDLLKIARNSSHAHTYKLTGTCGTSTTGVVIKNTAAKEPYKYIEGEKRKIEGTQGNTT